MISFISRLIGFINQSIAALGITAGVAVAFINVVARYVFDASFTWATELTIFLFLWSAFFAAAYCFKEDAHIAVTIVLDILPPKVAKVMMIISHIVSIIFLLAVSYYGYEYLLLVIDIDERSIDLWDMPMWIPYLVIPVSFLFAGYRVLEKLIVIFKTPSDKVLKESEAEMILHGMGGDLDKRKEKMEKMVKDAEKSTGGML